MLLKYFLKDFEMVPVAHIITVITFVFYFLLIIIIIIIIIIKWVPVTMAWHVLRLRMEEWPPVMEGSCEYIEKAVADS
jgi:hypothetical protein